MNFLDLVPNNFSVREHCMFCNCDPLVVKACFSCSFLLLLYIHYVFPFNIYFCVFLPTRTELCRFSGAKIYPGKGIRFVRGDSQVICITSLFLSWLLFLLVNYSYLKPEWLTDCSGLCPWRFSSLLIQSVRGTSTTVLSRRSFAGLLCTGSSIRRLALSLFCCWAVSTK